MAQLSELQQHALELQKQYAEDVASGLLLRGHFRYTDKNGNSVTTETHPLEGTRYVGKEFISNK